MTRPLNPKVKWKDGEPCRGRMRHGATADDYRLAVNTGPDEPEAQRMFTLAYEWHDKKHRLVYDLAGEVKHDGSDAGLIEHPTRFIQTSTALGLTDAQVARAVAVLL